MKSTERSVSRPLAAAAFWRPIDRKNPRWLSAAFLFGLSVAVSGCSSGGAGSSAKSDVAAAEVALTTADTLAAAYVSLPACGGATKVCSDPATVTKIRAAAANAYAQVKQAEAQAAAGQPVDTLALTTAISALQAIIPPVQPVTPAKATSL